MGPNSRSLAAISAVLGAWVVAAPFVFGVEYGVARWNHVVVGGLIVLAAGYDAATAGEGGVDRIETATLVSLLGLWTFASPFLFGFPDRLGFWNDVVVGALIATVASYNAYRSRDREPGIEVETT